MRPDDLFHPDHVVPSPEFAAAFVKRPDFGESHMLMELLTVMGQIFIILDRITDTDIQIQNSHIFQDLLQSRNRIDHIRDRIVHRFIFDVIYPFWDRRFIYDSFSTRTGKGTSFGIRRVEEQIRKVTRNYQKEAFVIKLDLQGFFMSLPREKVFERAVFGLKRQFPRGGKLYSTTKFLLEQVIFDEPTNGVRLFGKREEFQKIPRDKSLFYSGEGRGLVIGNLTSQILANIYLDQLDRFVKFKLGYKFYGRYADDFYILVPEEELVKAKRDIGEIERFLREELRLKLHPKKRYIQNIKKGIPFLGVVIYPGRKVPGRRVRANFRKRAREVASGVRNPEIITSYLGYMKNLNGKKVTKKVFEENGWSFKF